MVSGDFCPTGWCFFHSSRYSTCRLLTRTPTGDCPFFKTEEQFRNDWEKADAHCRENNKEKQEGMITLEEAIRICGRE